MTDLKTAFLELRDLLSLVPVATSQSFNIQGTNNLGVDIIGVLHNDAFSLDRMQIDPSTETRWTIQQRDIHFIVLKGSVMLRFKLNDNIHDKPLNKKQSLRIPAGIPFMLKTFEQDAVLLLISISGGLHE